jgi:hypothetical protein
MKNYRDISDLDDVDTVCFVPDTLYRFWLNDEGFAVQVGAEFSPALTAEAQAKFNYRERCREVWIEVGDWLYETSHDMAKKG